jgi:hypothetical protein
VLVVEQPLGLLLLLLLQVERLSLPLSLLQRQVEPLA